MQIKKYICFVCIALFTTSAFTIVRRKTKATALPTNVTELQKRLSAAETENKQLKQTIRDLQSGKEVTGISASQKNQLLAKLKTINKNQKIVEQRFVKATQENEQLEKELLQSKDKIRNLQATITNLQIQKIEE